ncbi:hypothetical protein KXD96_11000 [Mycobacterium sp. SMC-2]|uniref:hypothetical protein n=1 Tax=Mycobacterium sp. SMC-2 TaxID=2857058 RepID=UPI0021B2A395|nr:hypothetical protein [Mycobacterium sp. SMC-2]UXA08550.1 hypothetical protein KXD96_11000 [Mycobacterium sp. SMC-2]
MTAGGWGPAARDATTARPRWDVPLSIVLVVFAVLGWVAATGIEILMLAFTDYCPPERCSVERAVNAVTVSVLAAGAFTVVGAVCTIVRMARRRLGWPYAATTLAASVVAEVLGIGGYIAAVS